MLDDSDIIIRRVGGGAILIIADVGWSDWLAEDNLWTGGTVVRDNVQSYINSLTDPSPDSLPAPDVADDVSIGERVVWIDDVLGCACYPCRA